MSLVICVSTSKSKNILIDLNKLLLSTKGLFQAPNRQYFSQNSISGKKFYTYTNQCFLKGLYKAARVSNCFRITAVQIERSDQSLPHFG